MRIAVIASSRHPISEPFAGGLESHTAYLAAGLRARGHEVTLFAADGPTAGRNDFRPSAAAQEDPSMPAAEWLADHHAYLTLMLHLADHADDFDVIHNNCLHHLPVAMARAVRIPMVTTLHTPPTPWLESAVRAGPCASAFVAVSRFTARSWGHALRVDDIVPNGVDTNAWRVGPGGEPVVWFGRMVPEKGPELAIRAARAAGVPLLLAGPISDEAFFDRHVAPLLGDGIDYLGHLRHDQLTELVGSAHRTLVTPRWDEPYGLVAAESLACGTPVIGLRRGGLPEVVDTACGHLVDGENIPALAAAITRVDLSRDGARRRAERACSIDTMIDRYEAVYATVARTRPAA